jgi:molybdate transport system substrate-binding protein
VEWFPDRRAVLAALGALALPTVAAHGASSEPVRIFAAATLKDALDAAMAAAAAAVDAKVIGVYGPSPALVRQLEDGAPGDIFFSADPDWMNDAVKRNIVDPASRIDLLSSKLVLVAPASHARETVIGPGFPLEKMLGDGRLAMCDPMMMPAGRYGRAALQKLGVWESVKTRIANAADVRAALAYVARGEAPLGIVFDTDARLEPDVKVIGTFPADSTPPIVYPVAAVARSTNPSTRPVLRYLVSPQARPIFEKFGYRFLPRS